MSLPVRERGLKLSSPRERKTLNMSLPVRERGLKRVMAGFIRITEPSLPVRERGLKRGYTLEMYHSLRRSPCGSVD